MIFSVNGETRDTSDMIWVDPAESPHRGIFVLQDHSRVYAIYMTYEGIAIRRLVGDTLRTLAATLKHPALLAAAALEAA